MTVFLTRRAEKNYQFIKDYLSEEWGTHVAQAFEQRTIDLLDLLSNFPDLGPVELPEKQIHGFQLTKQIRIFYRLKANRIIILSFFDVRQDPRKKPQ
ncbi:MAG: type II toxin-antitoxin system RelE/ParE family toxin [Sphingobacteriaceae bacterium]